jgi:hypothetical protein
VPLNNGTYNDQGMFDGATNKAVAPIAWHQNGTNLPTDMRARLLDGTSTVVHDPVQTKTLTDSVITLELATLLQLAASDELRLQSLVLRSGRLCDSAGLLPFMDDAGGTLPRGLF